MQRATVERYTTHKGFQSARVRLGSGAYLKKIITKSNNDHESWKCQALTVLKPKITTILESSVVNLLPYFFNEKIKWFTHDYHNIFQQKMEHFNFTKSYMSETAN